MSGLGVRLLRIKYAARTLRRASSPRIFVNSIPKSGTNLIVSLADAYGRLRLSGPFITPWASLTDLGRAGGLVFGHVENVTDHLSASDFEDGFLLVRRPQAYVLSLARYIDVNSRHPAHSALTNIEPGTLLTAVIEGFQVDRFRLPSVLDRYACYLDSAEVAGLRIVDYDRLLNAPVLDSPEADLLAFLGGPDHTMRFEAAMTRSRETSSTWRHSQRATRDFSLGDGLATHPILTETTVRYEAAIRR